MNMALFNDNFSLIFRCMLMAFMVSSVSGSAPAETDRLKTATTNAANTDGWTIVDLEDKKDDRKAASGTTLYQSGPFQHSSGEEEDAEAEDAAPTQRCKCNRSACCVGTIVGSALTALAVGIGAVVYFCNCVIF